MPLQIRRGTQAELNAITPILAEPIYTTDTKKLFIGDGTTVGGIAVTGSGFTGSAGSNGFTGSTGYTGSRGADGQTSNYFNYTAKTNATSGDPGSGNFYWNAAIQTATTVLLINHIDDDGIDINIFNHLLNENCQVIVQDRNNSANYQIFTVTAGITEQGAYDTVPVTFDSAGGTGITGFANNHPMTLIYLIAGQVGPTGETGFTGSRGDTGPQGPQGPAGFTGSSGIGTAGYTGSAGSNGYTGSAGSYNQSLNTTDSVTFSNVTVTNTVTTTHITAFDVVIDGGGRLSPAAGGGPTIQVRSPQYGAAGITGGPANLSSSTSWVAAYDTTATFGELSGGVGIHTSIGTVGKNWYFKSDGSLKFPDGTSISSATGLQGYSGSVGLQGDTGFTGSKGDIGPTGPQGPQGDVGPQGPGGYLGSTGFTGSQGMNGTPGLLGFTGSKGDSGFTGSVGTNGFSGSQGGTGYTGSQGTAGYNGSVGFTGSQGIQGTNGFTGSAGAGFNFRGEIVQADNYYLNDVVTDNGSTFVAITTIAGGPTNVTTDTSKWLPFVSKGSTGFTGSFGLTGFTGSAGTNGTNGAAGYNGSVGFTGSVGNTGSTGPQGPQGDIGVTGYTGSAGTNGFTGSKGDTGFTGSQGLGFAPQSTNKSLATDGSVIGTNINWYVADYGSFAVGNFINLVDQTSGSTYFYVGKITLIQYAGGFGWAIHADISGAGGTANGSPSSSWIMELTGKTGSTGFTGSQGTAGYNGSAGTNGFTGSKGDTGFTGSKGDTGSTGPQGPQGDIGGTGFTGSAGTNGAAGYNGSKGDTGFTGSKGQGFNFLGVWDNSVTYIPYDVVTFDAESYVNILTSGGIGQSPANGTYWTLIAAKGSAGYNGSTGFTGSTGTNGAAGYNGSVGFTGSKGDIGVTGPTGPQGTGGYLGSTGYTGSVSTVAGPSGPSGPQGPGGYLGSTGFTGSAGTNGTNGAAGYNGSTGYTGSASTVSGPSGYTGSVGGFGSPETIYSLGTTNGTIAPNFTNGTVQTITLNGNLTLNAFTSPVAGQSITLIVIQDSTGTRTLTSSMKFAGGNKILSALADSVDMITIFYDGTNYYASLTKAFV